MGGYQDPNNPLQLQAHTDGDTLPTPRCGYQDPNNPLQPQAHTDGDTLPFSKVWDVLTAVTWTAVVTITVALKPVYSRQVMMY